MVNCFVGRFWGERETSFPGHKYIEFTGSRNIETLQMTPSQRLHTPLASLIIVGKGHRPRTKGKASKTMCIMLWSDCMTWLILHSPSPNSPCVCVSFYIIELNLSHFHTQLIFRFWNANNIFGKILFCKTGSSARVKIPKISLTTQSSAH